MLCMHACMHAHSAAISSWIPNDRQPDDIMIAIDPAEAHKPYNGRRSIYATRSMNVPNSVQIHFKQGKGDQKEWTALNLGL